MRKMIISALMLAATLTAAEKAQAQEPILVDEVVAVVGNSAILYSELKETADMLVSQRKEQGYTSDRDPINEALEALLTQKLLHNQALIDSVTVNNAAIEEQVEMDVEDRIAQAGSIAHLETLYHKPIYEIKDDVRNQLEEQTYASSMKSEITGKVKITPGEVEKYYKSMGKDKLPVIPEQYVYAQITKYPSATQQAKQRARERLLDMRERILNGDKFDMLARMYSEDPSSAVRGGEMDFMPLNSLTKSFADALAKLQPNQISGVVETEYGFHLVQLLEKNGNLYRCRHILIKPVFTNDELAEAGNMLDSLANMIRLDSITFEQAAIKFSDDKYSKQNGGIATNHELLEYHNVSDTEYSSTKFFKEDLGNDYNAMRTLKVGEISSSFFTQDLRGNMLSKIVKIVEIIPSHTASLNNDYVDLERVALQDKQGMEFEKWLNQKIDAMYVRISPKFRDGDFVNKRWVK